MKKRSTNIEFIGDELYTYICSLNLCFILFLLAKENVNDIEKCNRIQFGKFPIFSL